MLFRRHHDEKDFTRIRLPKSRAEDGNITLSAKDSISLQKSTYWETTTLGRTRAREAAPRESHDSFSIRARHISDNELNFRKREDARVQLDRCNDHWHLDNVTGIAVFILVIFLLNPLVIKAEVSGCIPRLKLQLHPLRRRTQCGLPDDFPTHISGGYEPSSLALKLRGGKAHGKKKFVGSSYFSEFPSLDQGSLETMFDKYFGQGLEKESVTSLLKQKSGDVLDSLTKKLLGPETSFALKSVRRIIERFEDDHKVVNIFSKYPSRDLVLSFFALSKLQRASQLCTVQNESTRNMGGRSNSNYITATTNPRLLSDLAHYSIFASCAYGWKFGLAFLGRFRLGDNKTLARRTGISDDDVVYTQWQSQTHKPAFFIVRDHKRQNIVLTVRGTLNAPDVLTDLCATAEHFESGEDGSEKGVNNSPFLLPFQLYHRTAKAHHGMLEGARGIAKTARPIVEKELNDHPNFDLVIVGHSMGGGVASVLTALWKPVFPSRKVRAYCYGPPCVFPAETDDWFDDSIISVVGEGDPFSDLSLGHIANLSQGLSFLCEDKELREEAISRRKGSINKTPDDDNIRWLDKSMSRLRSKMTGEVLYPPGRLLLMKGFHQGENGANNVTLEIVDRTRFQDLILHPRMFDLTRHNPVRYENELRHLWLDHAKHQNRQEIE